MMLALSTRQPSAWAVFHAEKGIENRRWPWPHELPLPCRILIHASSALNEYDFGSAGIFGITGQWPPRAEALPLGAIVGAVTVSDCVVDHDSPWFAGPFGFVLETPALLPRPVPCRGQRGIWEIPADVEREVRELARGLRQ